MTKPLKAPSVPCGSCPYRRDVPSGIWTQHEYDKLPAYDADFPFQPQARFDCHQRDGNLCGGWLACHGAENLLSLRLLAVIKPERLDPAVFDYSTDVPVFASGSEARAHGIREIAKPKRRARKMVRGLMKLKGVRGR